jgi:hypothetical protein
MSEENNILMGRFMDYEFHDTEAHLLNFAEDWNWLMPVGKKIMDLINPSDLEKESEAWLTYYMVESHLGLFDIEKVYNDFIILIKWYNQQNK